MKNNQFFVFKQIKTNIAWIAADPREVNPFRVDVDYYTQQGNRNYIKRIQINANLTSQKNSDLNTIIFDEIKNS
jgi:hypothetical protein